MPINQFEEELRRTARFDTHQSASDPLGAALVEINAHPTYNQSRLLTRVLHALADHEGDFRRAEIAGLDIPTVKLVLALLDAERAGTITRDAWLKALAAADKVTGG